jgi:hypothetical protein
MLLLCSVPTRMMGGGCQYCWSTDGARTWTLQTGVNVTVAPQAATPTLVTAVLPATLAQGLAVTWQLDGPVPSSSSMLAWIDASGTLVRPAYAVLSPLAYKAMVTLSHGDARGGAR